MGGDRLLCKPNLFPAGGLGALYPTGVWGRAPEANAFWQKSFANELKIRSLFGRRVQPYFRSDKRRSLVGTAQIGSAVRGCVKLVDIRMLNIESDRLVTSLVYCAIYDQLLVLRALGGPSYRTGIILVVVRMAARVFFFGVRIWLVMTFNYPVLWVRVKGQG